MGLKSQEKTLKVECMISGYC